MCHFLILTWRFKQFDKCMNPTNFYLLKKYHKKTFENPYLIKMYKKMGIFDFFLSSVQHICT